MRLLCNVDVQEEEHAEPVLETREILKSFPNGGDVIEVLKGVTFKVSRGETVTIQPVHRK